jgi:nucleoid-associated protein YgaU
MVIAPVRENKIIPWETAESVASSGRRSVARERRQTVRRRGFGYKLGLTLGLSVALLAAGTAVARQGVTSEADRALAMVNVPETVMHTVQPGDTLWTLARRFGDPRLNITDRVDNLVRVNGFAGAASLHPGQKILLRVEHPAELAKLRLNRVEGRLVAEAAR